MKTGRRTTYILLERGDEDRRLKQELDIVFSKLGIASSIEMVKKFPMLMALRQGLSDELKSEEE